jgi:hypothetical protein
VVVNTPPDLAHITVDTRARCERVAIALNAIARGTDTPFGDPRGVYVELIVSGHEIEAAIAIMRRNWWPI